MTAINLIPQILKPMKTSTVKTATALFVCCLLAVATKTQAVILEPDNVIYGTVVIDTTPVTADQTDVVIEAQRIPGGEVVSSYRMGSNPALGSFYSLNLKLESVSPINSTNASQASDMLNIVLKNASGVIGTTTYQIIERGRIQRVDFGAPVEDADGNGLPDLWELTYLNTSGVDPSQIGANGLTALQNYVAGTDPGDPSDTFRLQIDGNGSSIMVSFLALRAEGPGYSDKTRFYTLESNNNGGAGAWTPVPGFVDVAGDNQMVEFTPSGLSGSKVYRGIVRLAALQFPGSPRLAIQKLPGNLLRLSWPSAATGFQLQENSNPQSTSWSNVGLTASDDGKSWSVIVSSPTGNRFYRLIK